MRTLMLSQSDVRALVTMTSAISVVEGAFAAHGRGEALMPAKVYLALPQHHGDFRAMPAYLAGSAGVKWVNSHPENPARHGLPSVLALYILSDAETAAPLAVMDGTLLTAIRTGAAAAVASKYLARPRPSSIGFVGCGVQSRFLLEAHRALFGEFEVLGYDPSPQAAERFATETGGRSASLAEAAGADIVCTATPARAPVVDVSLVRSGAHINAMGADAPGKQELDARVLSSATVVIDDWEQATESGEVNVPLHTGVYRREQIHGTLGEIVAGKKSGRRGDETAGGPKAASSNTTAGGPQAAPSNTNTITVFDSTGLAIQDLALARHIYDRAREKGVGAWIELIP